ncbi:hypothetical protein ACO22_04766 [Paracoccidioides brasiliensis]|uniref:Phosphoglucomutase n=1 Tax=Paracoccidioides brasiliensis TaxID=121759 RepID=A0A1D2JC63_PARBR|nr:hypothetical protein ACO22_04766 [Paracoccidioides brasiliensis]
MNWAHISYNGNTVVILGANSWAGYPPMLDSRIVSSFPFTMILLSDLVTQWLAWDQDPQTREEIICLRDEKKDDELEKRLRKYIEFGTAGLRGRMQGGFSSMNALTVIQASQGLGKFIEQFHCRSPAQGAGQDSPTVIIGRDARHNSEKFAALAANAFAAQGIRVLWYENAGPTPLVPFGVLAHRAAAGVMITASHNPACDNGLYTSAGCQINTPMDAQIAQLIQENLEPWPSAWATLDQNKYLTLDSYEDTAKMYCGAVTRFINSIRLITGPPRQFVYTPLHGVGYATMSRLCEELGITDMITVAEQQEPNPDFPTVVFPNPEEAGALDLAMKTADAVNRSLIIANDPDADRLAVAEKVNGIWVKFTGDQLGILLASYMLDAIQAETQSQQETPTQHTKKIAMLTTAVSTSMLSKLAAAESIHFQETLTGFKWLGNVARRLQTQASADDAYTVPFAFEEALGYMFPAISYDKDGLTAAMVFLAAETTWRVRDGLTPYEKLMELYGTYGYHESLNGYFVSPSRGVTDELFEGIRREFGPVARAGSTSTGSIGSLPILRWRDVTRGVDVGEDSIAADGPGSEKRLPVDPSSQMLTVWSERGIRFTLRGSGTEPKVKIYIESCCDSREEAVKAVCYMFTTVLEHWVKPHAPTMTWAREMVTSSGHVLRAA